MKSYLKKLVIMLVGCALVGCENQGSSDNGGYERYVTVEVNAYTTWPIDVYIGDAFVGGLEPGRSTSFSKELYGNEKLRLRFVVFSPYGTYEKGLSFDADYDRYHVNVYDDHIERY